jgi:hypothetical protein
MGPVDLGLLTDEGIEAEKGFALRRGAHMVTKRRKVRSLPREPRSLSIVEQSRTQKCLQIVDFDSSSPSRT